MTKSRDPDALLSAYLSEGMEVLPERVVDAVLDEVHRTHQRTGRPWRTHPMFKPGLAAAALVGALAVIGSAALVGSLVVPEPRLATPPAQVVAPPVNSPTAAVPTSAPTVSPSPSCAGVESPAAVRITDVVLPDIDSGPLGRPAVAGCAVWLPSGDNGGGIHRIDLVTGAVTNANPAEVIGEVDADGDQLWALGSPTRAGADGSALFRLDPMTGEVLAELPVGPQATAVMRIAGGRAWVGFHRAGLKAFDLSTGAIVATPIDEGRVFAIETGAGAVWAMTSAAASPGGPSASGDRSKLFRIDISTGEVTDVPIPRTFGDFAIAGGHLYTGTELGEVQQIDPISGAIVTSVRLDDVRDVSITLVAEGSSVWALPIRTVPFGSEFRLKSTELVEIDSATGAIRSRIEYQASQPVDLWAAGGSLWLSQADKPLVRFELPGRP